MTVKVGSLIVTGGVLLGLSGCGTTGELSQSKPTSRSATPVVNPSQTAQNTSQAQTNQNTGTTTQTNTNTNASAPSVPTASTTANANVTQPTTVTPVTTNATTPSTQTGTNNTTSIGTGTAILPISTPIATPVVQIDLIPVTNTTTPSTQTGTNNTTSIGTGTAILPISGPIATPVVQIDLIPVTNTTTPSTPATNTNISTGAPLPNTISTNVSTQPTVGTTVPVSNATTSVATGGTANVSMPSSNVPTELIPDDNTPHTPSTTPSGSAPVKIDKPANGGVSNNPNTTPTFTAPSDSVNGGSLDDVPDTTTQPSRGGTISGSTPVKIDKPADSSVGSPANSSSGASTSVVGINGGSLDDAPDTTNNNTPHTPSTTPSGSAPVKIDEKDTTNVTNVNNPTISNPGQPDVVISLDDWGDATKPNTGGSVGSTEPKPTNITTGDLTVSPKPTDGLIYEEPLDDITSTTATAFTTNLNDSKALNITRVVRPTDDIAKEIQEAVKYTNELRAEKGLKPLVYDENLSAFAQMRASEYEVAILRADGDTETRRRIAHLRLDGRRYSDEVTGYGSTGENLAFGYENGKAVVMGWKESAGHYRNIINSNYERIGIGFIRVPNGDDYDYYWVQIFGSDSIAYPYEFVDGEKDNTKVLTAIVVDNHTLPIALPNKGEWHSFNDNAYHGWVNGYNHTRFGAVTPTGTTDLRLFYQGQQTADHAMPKSGSASYRGTALIVKDGKTDTDIQSQFTANFDTRTLDGTLTQNNTTLYQLSAHINGSGFASKANAPVQTQGAFFGEKAEELAGVFKDTQSNAQGVFGATQSK